MELDARFTALSILTGYVLVASLERFSGLRLRPSPLFRPAFATDVGWYLTVVGITLAFGPVLERLAVGRAAMGLPGLELLDLSWTAKLILAVVLYDALAFISHRMLHRFALLWRIHKVHHSSPVLDWLATTRAHGLEHLARGIPTQAFLLAIGVPASALAVALSIYAFFATLGHSNLRLNLAWIEPLCVTPRIHHLHHVPDTTERNFGTILTIWDRLCGSLLIKPADAGECLGVPGEIDRYPQSWPRQLFEPFRAET